MLTTAVYSKFSPSQ
uniref:Uncharacterized protein n=1 Tax=Anguilla anguilla TaxID=7936 RepID=A0A0E9SPR3_ANGAN